MAENVEIKLELIENISKKLDEINGKLGQTGKDAEKAQDKLGGLNTKLININSAFQAMQTIWSTIGGTVSSVISLGAQAEQTAVSFSTLVGNEQKAAEVLDQINEYAIKTPFSQLQLTDAAKTMLNFGIESEKVNDDLKMLGDISMGDANKLNSLSLVFGQVASAGKMQGQDLMQFINQGFNPLKELADMTGMKYTELQAAMGKGLVTFDMVSAAIAHATGEGGQFYGMADKLSETVSGKWSTVVGEFQQLGIDLFNEFKPDLIELMNSLESLKEPLKSIAEFLVFIIQKVVDFAPAIIVVTTAIAGYNAVVKACTIATELAAAKQWLLNFAMEANPIGIVVAAIGALIAMIAELVIHYNQWGEALTVVLGPLGLVISMVMKFRELWGYIVDGFKTDGIIEGVKRIGQTIIASIISPLAKVFEAVGLDSIANGLKSLIVNGNVATTKATAKKSNTTTGATSATSGNANSVMGTDKIKELLSQNTAATKSNTKVGAKTKASADATATGGTRNTNITINFDKEMVAMNFTGGYLDNKAQVETTLEESLLRVLNSAKAAI